VLTGGRLRSATVTDVVAKHRRGSVPVRATAAPPRA
jgi:hypothetical protein